MPQNYLNDSLNNLNNSTSSKEATKNHQTHQPLHGSNPLTTNNIHDSKERHVNPNNLKNLPFTIVCKSNFLWINGLIGSVYMKWKQKMARKFLWIHDYMKSAELTIKLEKAPFVSTNIFFCFHDQIGSADLKLKLKMAPKFTWILVYIESTESTIKSENTFFPIHDLIEQTKTNEFNKKLTKKLHQNLQQTTSHGTKITVTS